MRALLRQRMSYVWQRAALLTHLDQILPKDMPFVDIESGSLWGGNPLQ